MRSAVRLLRLTSVERRLLVHAAFLQIVAVVLLRVVRLGVCRRVFARLAVGGARTIDTPVDRIAWAIGATAARLPFDVGCLARAFATAALLERYGMRAFVKIGVSQSRPDRPDSFAHAWVECDGRVLFTETSRHYVALDA